MSKIEVKTVVCDYGIYEGEKLQLVINDRWNAELIKNILECDRNFKRYEVLVKKETDIESELK